VKTFNRFKWEALSVVLVLVGVCASVPALIPAAGALTLLSLFDVI
jgi:hypothetical protein